MLHIIVNPGKFGSNQQFEWAEGAPVPEALNNADVVADFRAHGRELELFVAAMNGDLVSRESIETDARRPRFVQIVPGPRQHPFAALFAVDEQGSAWQCKWREDTPKRSAGYVWSPMAEFER